MFTKARASLERLHPGYIPQTPAHLRILSRCIGYRGAEEIAYHYRRIKQRLRSGAVDDASQGRGNE